ncbi:MAG: pantoate--beta-alanine ligase [Elusimicrobia bacterium HGW-Elusimicrobia-1]|jgi:pantoate--beta-alanine ligase|nr:MAG: pantoate--beta-alanine ligase [Elusimicrobia bacterium HGW-Elusimicrobia-1]
MKIITSVAAAQKYAAQLKSRGKTVGLVPTMGALHDGHASLIKRAARENDAAVVSIFVNPAQFGPKEDFKNYPRTFARDKAVCRKAGAEAIFFPSAKDMYPEGFAANVVVGGLSEKYCGASRPHHFDGVATVISKLFNITRPTRAYFGQKDYQQLKIIERLARALNFPVKIVACPTAREKSGLAMSSRNARLSAPERERAAAIYRIISAAKKNPSRFAGADGSRLPSPRILERKIRGALGKIPSARVEYVAATDSATLETLRSIPRGTSKWRILIAVKMGGTRLIDNV